MDLAEVVVEAEVFPKCLTCLKYPDEFVQKHAATLVSTRVARQRSTHVVRIQVTVVLCQWQVPTQASTAIVRDPCLVP